MPDFDMHHQTNNNDLAHDTTDTREVLRSFKNEQQNVEVHLKKLVLLIEKLHNLSTTKDSEVEEDTASDIEDRIIDIEKEMEQVKKERETLSKEVMDVDKDQEQDQKG